MVGTKEDIERRRALVKSKSAESSECWVGAPDSEEQIDMI